MSLLQGAASLADTKSGSPFAANQQEGAEARPLASVQFFKEEGPK
jgi:hypothetical protein